MDLILEVQNPMFRHGVLFSLALCQKCKTLSFTDDLNVLIFMNYVHFFCLHCMLLYLYNTVKHNYF